MVRNGRASIDGDRPSSDYLIENWAPVEDIRVYARDSEWSKAHLRPASFCAIYSGTLGYKHNAELLELARSLEGDVIVYSEGEAVEAFKRRAQDDCRGTKRTF